MGNYRFRLSDMMPNAWFYKLKDMSSRTRKCNISQKKLPRPTKSQQKPCLSQLRYYSYHITTEPNRADKVCNSPINPKVSDTHFPDHSPRLVSSNRKSKRKSMYKPSPTLVSSSVSAGCSCRATFNSVWTKSADTSRQYEDYSVSSTDCSPQHEDLFHEFEPDTAAASDPFYDDTLASCCGSCNCRVSSSTNDIIIDMDDKSFTRKIDKFDDFDTISELELPPILTKPPKFNLTTTATTEVTKITTSSSKLEEALSIKIVKEGSRIKAKKKEPNSNPVLPRKSSSTSSTKGGVKLRTNTPRIASRKIQGYGRKSISSTTTTSKSRSRKFSESFAIVKSSNDPERDFRDSMMEMIIENNIRASKDLEELLACYLLLNSNEYHDLIVKAFEQIWFDMTQRRILLKSLNFHSAT